MRISGGHLKGRRVEARKIINNAADRTGCRPTSSKVREAVFNILQNEINDAVFLDLYAGTGAMGFEALSRGAGRVFFVEKNPEYSEFITNYLQKISLNERSDVLREKAENFIKRSSKSGQLFDIIFADPPYASDEINIIVLTIDECNNLKENGCLIVEHSTRKWMPDNIRNLVIVKKYKYGDTMLTLYRKRQ